MAREILHNTPFARLEYDSRGFLYFNWIGYVSVEQIKTAASWLLEAVVNKGVHNLINDNRQLMGTWTQAIRWLADEFIPRAVAIGLRRIAYIYSPQASARYSVDKFLEENDMYVAQTFEHYDEAERWILQELNLPTAPLSISVEGDLLSIRENGKHVIIRLEDINYVAADGKFVVIDTNTQTYRAKLTLRDFETRLPGKTFLRVHRGFIIALDKISHIVYAAGGSYIAFLRSKPKLQLPVSRKYAALLKKRLSIR